MMLNPAGEIFHIIWNKYLRFAAILSMYLIHAVTDFKTKLYMCDLHKQRHLHLVFS